MLHGSRDTEGKEGIKWVGSRRGKMDGMDPPPPPGLIGDIAWRNSNKEQLGC